MSDELCLQMRLEELRALDISSGRQISDSALKAAETLLTKRPVFCSAFRLFPTATGGILIDFEHNGWDYSVEFSEIGSAEIYGIEIDGPGKLEPQEFDAVAEEFLSAFDSRVNAMDEFANPPKTAQIYDPEWTIIGDIIDHTSLLAWAGEWDKLDSELGLIDPSTLSEIEMVTWARSTYPMRPKLPSWPEFISTCYEEAVRRGIKDADALFHGLRGA